MPTLEAKKICGHCEHWEKVGFPMEQCLHGCWKTSSREIDDEHGVGGQDVFLFDTFEYKDPDTVEVFPSRYFGCINWEKRKPRKRK